MLELGINLEDQENSEDLKLTDSEDVILEDAKKSSENDHDNEKTELENAKDEEIDQTIESVPFISEPIKKKKTRVSK